MAKLGDKVVDPISGFDGTVTRIIHEFLGGTVVVVTASKLDHGKPVEVGFDIDRLQVTEEYTG